MDIDQLRTFLEVTRQKSFSRAAQKLSVTQPSISAQIRSLEKFFGYRLLERGGGKVTLTAAGRLFEPFAEDFLSRLNHLQLALGDLERSPRGMLTVSANDSTALYVLPTFFSSFRKQYPRVALNIIRAERSRTLEMVQNREVDFGVVSLPVKDPRLHVEVVHEDELVLTVQPDHPFAGRSTVTLDEVASSRLLAVKAGRRREKLDMLFLESKLSPRIAMEVDSNELLKRLILAGIGIGFLPRINVVDEVRLGSLAVVVVEGVHLPRSLALIFRNDRDLNRAAEVFFSVATGLKRPSALENSTIKERSTAASREEPATA